MHDPLPADGGQTMTGGPVRAPTPTARVPAPRAGRHRGERVGRNRGARAARPTAAAVAAARLGRRRRRAREAAPTIWGPRAAAVARRLRRNRGCGRRRGRRLVRHPGRNTASPDVTGNDYRGFGGNAATAGAAAGGVAGAGAFRPRRRRPASAPVTAATAATAGTAVTAARAAAWRRVGIYVNGRTGYGAGTNTFFRRRRCGRRRRPVHRDGGAAPTPQNSRVRPRPFILRTRTQTCGALY